MIQNFQKYIKIQNFIEISPKPYFDKKNIIKWVFLELLMTWREIWEK